MSPRWRYLFVGLGTVLAVGGCGARAAVHLTVPAARGDVSASWAEVRRTAREARKRNDYAAYEAAVRELYRRSENGRVALELVNAETALGRREAALEWLRLYAGMGLAVEDQLAALLDPLRSEAAFAPLANQLAANVAPVTHALGALDLPREDLITEDVTWDPSSRTFFVSSVRKRKVIALDVEGHARDFAAGDPSLGSASGLAIGGDRLWVASSELPPMIGYDPKGAHPTSLLAFDLRTGRRVACVPLRVAGEHALTDLAIDGNGQIYASDALGGRIYVLRPGASELEVLCPAVGFVSPQTPAVTPGGRVLYVPDYALGIARVDVETCAVSFVEHVGIALDGIDGLYSHDHALYAVQNGTYPVRVIRLELNADGSAVTRLEVLEQQSPGLGEPTHGVVVDGNFYFLANAGWTRFDDDGAPRRDAEPHAPRLVRLGLR